MALTIEMRENIRIRGEQIGDARARFWAGYSARIDAHLVAKGHDPERIRQRRADWADTALG